MKVFFFGKKACAQQNSSSEKQVFIDTQTQMSKKHSSPVLGFSIEIVYRILDHLEVPIILLSLQNVCTRFNTIINTYHQYQVISNTFTFIKQLSFYRWQIYTTLNLSTQADNDKQMQWACNALENNTVRDNYPLIDIISYLFRADNKSSKSRSGWCW